MGRWFGTKGEEEGSEQAQHSHNLALWSLELSEGSKVQHSWLFFDPT